MFYLADFKRRYEKELYKQNIQGELPQQFRGGNQGSFLGYSSSKKPSTKQSIVSNLENSREYLDRTKRAVNRQGLEWEGNRRMLNERRGGEKVGTTKKSNNSIGKKEAELRLRDVNLVTPTPASGNNKSLILPNSPQGNTKKIITSSKPQNKIQDLILPEGTRESMAVKKEITTRNNFNQKYPVPDNLEYKGLTDQNYKPLITASPPPPTPVPTKVISSSSPPTPTPKVVPPKVAAKNGFKLGKKAMYGLAGVGTLGALYGLNKVRQNRKQNGRY